MISAALLQKKLEAYANTPQGKAKMKVGLTEGSGMGTAPSIAEMNSMADSLIEHIQKHIPYQLEALGKTLKKSQPVKQPNGSYQITISFDHGSLFRESLRPDLYPEGVSNIVALFNNGYTAEKQIYGKWDRKGSDGFSGKGVLYVPSRQVREELQFMQSAVEWFQLFSYDHWTYVELGSDYTKSKTK